MTYLLISAGKCPKCDRMEYWEGMGFDYTTYERISWCDVCGYEKRVFDREAKETFEFLEKAFKEGKVGKSITIGAKRDILAPVTPGWVVRHPVAMTVILVGMSITIAVIVTLLVGG